jgi:hypothetical protein
MTETLLTCTIDDVVVGDQPIHKLSSRKGGAMTCVEKIGPYTVYELTVPMLREFIKHVDKNITIRHTSKNELVNVLIEYKKKFRFDPKEVPSEAPTFTTTGSHNKARMVNAAIDPSIPPLSNWKGTKTPADMTEKRLIGEDVLTQIGVVYNNEEMCNEPAKDFSWNSAKHDAGEFLASLDFKLTKHLTTVQDVHAKLLAIVTEYNQAYQVWKGENAERSGQHDVAKVPFEDKHIKTPWLVYCHSVAEKHPLFAKICRRELPPGVGASSTNPLQAVKQPPKKKAKKKQPPAPEVIIFEEELLASTKGVQESVDKFRRDRKIENLQVRSDALELQMNEKEKEIRKALEKKGKTGRSAYKSFKEKAVKKLASKAAAETSDDGAVLTQNSVKTDTTEFSAFEKLISKENEKEKVDLELEELKKK